MVQLWLGPQTYLGTEGHTSQLTTGFQMLQGLATSFPKPSENGFVQAKRMSRHHPNSSDPCLLVPAGHAGQQDMRGNSLERELSLMVRGPDSASAELPDYG